MEMIVRYYQKQLLEDQLKDRRERLQEGRKEEERRRLTELGYTGADSSLAELMRKERGVMLFRYQVQAVTMSEI